MAKTVGQGFQTFLSWIQPLESERKKATKHKESVRSSLVNNFKCYQFIETGSFGNGTGVRHYSDVDYFASIPTKILSNDSSYFLRKMKEKLNVTFWNTFGIEVNSPAVLIPFGQYASENMEITPCDFKGMTQTIYGRYPRYEIPDGGGQWMFSSPQAHNAYVKAADAKLNGKLKPVIQFVKAWKFMHNIPLISFYLEIRTTQFLDGSVIFSYDEALFRVFEHLYKVELASMRDPMGISGLIPAAKTPKQKETAFSKLETAVTRAEKAYSARLKGNDEKAFKYWSLIFNNQFPAR